MGRTEEATTDWTPLEKQSSPVKVFSPGKSSPVRLRLVPKKSFRSTRYIKFKFLQYSLYQIFRHIHETLNVFKKITKYIV